MGRYWQWRGLHGTHAFVAALVVAGLVLSLVGGCGESEQQADDSSDGPSSSARPTGGSPRAGVSKRPADTIPDWARKAVDHARRNRARRDQERIAKAREQETARAKAAAAQMRIQASLNAAGRMILDGKWGEAKAAYETIQSGSGGDGKLWRYGKKEATKALKGMDESGRAKPNLRNGADKNSPLAIGARKIFDAGEAKLRAEFELGQLRAATANQLRGWKHEKIPYASMASHFQALLWMGFSLSPIAAPESKITEAAQSLTKEAAPAVAAYKEAQKHSGIKLFIAELSAEDRLARFSAVKTLRSLGPSAKPAIPALIKAMQDQEGFVRNTALKAIIAVGPTATAAAEVLLQAAAEDDSAEALSVLVDMDLKGAAVEKELIDLWIDSHTSAVTWILMKLDPKMTKPIAAALKIAKNDPDTVRRCKALIKLGNLGPTAASAIPTVIQAAESDEAMAVRSRACNVLTKLDPAGKQCTPVLIKGLSDSDRDLRRSSFEALRTLRQAAKPALPALRTYVKTVTSQDKRRAESLIRLLGG